MAMREIFLSVCIVVAGIQRQVVAQVQSLGGEFQVNSYTVDGQINPSVAIEPNGNFIVVWNSKAQDGSQVAVYARRYDATGSPISSEFRVHEPVAGVRENSGAAVDGNGIAWILWQGPSDPEAPNAYSHNYFVRRFDSAGAALGDEMPVTPQSSASDWVPAITVDPLRGIATIARIGMDRNYPNIDYGIWVQRYDSTGATLGSEVRLGTTTATSVSLATDPNGGFVAVWSDASNTYGRHCDWTGSPLGPEMHLATIPGPGRDSSPPAVAFDANGEFAVTWYGRASTNGPYAIRGMHFDSLGNPTGSLFQLSSTSVSYKGATSLVGDPNGAFLAVWRNDGVDSNVSGCNSSEGGAGESCKGGIVARRFDTTGTWLENEIPINTYTPATQKEPVVVASPAGALVIAWQSYGQDGDNYGIYAARYSVVANTVTPTQAGTATETPTQTSTSTPTLTRTRTPTPTASIPVLLYEIGNEIPVNTYTADGQTDPSVAMAPDGSFIVVWNSTAQDGSQTAVYAQRFDAAVAPVSGEFRVHNPVAGIRENVGVAVDSNGVAWVMWHGPTYPEVPNGAAHNFFVRRFDRWGTPLADELAVTPPSSGSEYAPALTVDPGSGIATIARYGTDRNNPGNDYGIWVQRYDADGDLLGSEVRINTSVGTTLGLATDPSGGYVVIWSDGTDTFGRHFDEAGTPYGAEAHLVTVPGPGRDTSPPAVAFDASGGFALTWWGRASTNGPYAIRGQHFDPLGLPTGGLFQLSSTSVSYKGATALVGDPNGAFLAVWRNDGVDSNVAGCTSEGGVSESCKGGIVARRFDTSGNWLGNEIPINAYTDATQKEPVIAASTAGPLVVAWQSYGQDGSDYGIFARRYLASDVAPTATPLATMTASATASQTPTMTAVISPPAATPSVTASVTETATHSPSMTGTPTRTPSLTPTPTSTALCGESPRTDCLAPGINSLTMKVVDGTTVGKIKWQWLKGSQTDLSNLGDPTADTSYALCVYDETAGLPALVLSAVIPPGGNCGGRPCWSSKGSRGFLYSNRAADVAGIRKLSLQPGAEFHSAIKLDGGSALLPLVPVSTMQVFHQSSKVTVQLINDLAPSGVCWTSDFVAPPKINSATQFKDKES